MRSLLFVVETGTDTFGESRQRSSSVRSFLVPEGHTGVVIGIGRGWLAVVVLVLDLHLQVALEAHGICHVPAIHPVHAVFIQRMPAIRRRVGRPLGSRPARAELILG